MQQLHLQTPNKGLGPHYLSEPPFRTVEATDLKPAYGIIPTLQSEIVRMEAAVTCEVLLMLQPPGRTTQNNPKY